MLQTTLAIIKPDAVAARPCGEFWPPWKLRAFGPVALKMLRLSKAQAQGFYAVHKERPFFDSLTDYMSSGPVVCAALRGEDAVARYRALMGATNPTQAEPGTLRRKYGQNLEANAVHGSDCPENAAVELAYFFNGLK